MAEQVPQEVLRRTLRAADLIGPGRSWRYSRDVIPSLL